MGIYLDKPTVEKDLEKLGIPLEHIGTITAYMNENIPLKASSKNVDIRIGDTIQILCPPVEEEDVMPRLHRFVARIPGVDTRQIRSVTIPTLDYGKTDLLELDIRLGVWAANKKALYQGE